MCVVIFILCLMTLHLHKKQLLSYCKGALSLACNLNKEVHSSLGKKELTGKFKHGNGQTEEEEKGVVRPRPAGLAVSAIMQLLQVFGLGEMGVGCGGVGGLVVGRGLTVLCSWTGWGRKDTEKRGEAMRRGKIYRVADFFFLEAWPSCLPHNAFCANLLHRGNSFKLAHRIRGRFSFLFQNHIFLLLRSSIHI